MTYEVMITEILQKAVSVEAASKAKAEAKVQDAWNRKEYVLDFDCFQGVQLRAFGEAWIDRPQTSGDERLLAQQQMMVRILRTIEAEERCIPFTFIKMKHLVEWAGEDMANAMVDAYKKLSGNQVYRDALIEMAHRYEDLSWDYVEYVLGWGGWLILRALAKNGMEWYGRILGSAVEQYCKDKDKQPSEPFITPAFAGTILECFVRLLMDRINEAVGNGLYLSTISDIMRGFPSVPMMAELIRRFKNDGGREEKCDS